MSRVKPFEISKQIVLEAFKKVKANRGSAGIDNVTIEMFEKDLKDNLYKIWNRMSSGTYFPPAVREEEIPKADGKTRTLGIPTVSDRVAQMVVKMYLEPILDPCFHPDSYGYRPGKSAKQAIAITRKRCWKNDWVIDIDIKGFFDNMDHKLVMKAVEKHTDSPWIKLYVERWLKAPMQRRDGTLVQRQKGTPQGGVISPLLANLFMHYAFDEWMKRKHPGNPFARYADDVVVHCETQQQAESLLEEIRARLKQCLLELHPEKTKIIYCKDDNRGGTHEHEKFDYLGYTFRTRSALNRWGKLFMSFIPAVSNKASQKIRDAVREWNIHKHTDRTLNCLVRAYNPIIRGWLEYYGQFYSSEIMEVLRCIDEDLIKWAMRKYKKLRSRKKASEWLETVSKRDSRLFCHWTERYKETRAV